MPAERILIVAAHPDDETIGAGIRMSRAPDAVTVLHITDGALGHREKGFSTPCEYARSRRSELHAAMALIGIQPRQCLELGYPDQRARDFLPEIAAAIAEAMRRLKPAAILTHPYEGGHPDHDSAAFAARLAGAPRIVEFTSYHAGPGGLETGRFLPYANAGGERALELTTSERDLKGRMFACFRSQTEVLKNFGMERESFRAAPAYDFSRPPHAGELYYETQGWGAGAKWRERAGEALMSQ